MGHLRVESGGASLSLPTGRTKDGLVVGTDINAPLSPSGRQLDLTAQVDLPLLGGELSLAATHSRQPQHQKGAPHTSGPSSPATALAGNPALGEATGQRPGGRVCDSSGCPVPPVRAPGQHLGNLRVPSPGWAHTPLRQSPPAPKPMTELQRPKGLLPPEMQNRVFVEATAEDWPGPEGLCIPAVHRAATCFQGACRPPWLGKLSLSPLGTAQDNHLAFCGSWQPALW